MVIDASAAVATLLGEVEDEIFAADPMRIMSAVSVLEQASSKRASEPWKGASWTSCCSGRIDVVPFNLHQLELARAAHGRFGMDITRSARFSATAAPTLRRRHWENRCFSMARSSFGPTSRTHSRH